MGPIEIILLVFAGIAAMALILFLVYVLVLVRPGRRVKPSPALLCEYAHRGLYGNGVPENSLLAFELACQRGCGIELDVQLSRDGKVVVFHDGDLKRMTGVDRKVCELSASELTALKLAGTDQTIPLLSDVLCLVNGRVPLLVELKSDSLTDASICKKVADVLDGYGGAYCIESFNPKLIKEMKKCLPGVFYGQLYTNSCRDTQKHSPLHIAISLMAFNFMSKPDFIAYNKADRASLPVKLATKLYPTPAFVWTPKGEDEVEEAHRLGEIPIFETE